MGAGRYLYLLYGQRAKLNPQHAVLGMMPGNPGFEGAVRHARSKDVEVQSTVFLWGSYEPRVYYWEVLEMVRNDSPHPSVSSEFVLVVSEPEGVHESDHAWVARHNGMGIGGDDDLP